jgi:hypothetical protein
MSSFHSEHFHIWHHAPGFSLPMRALEHASPGIDITLLPIGYRHFARIFNPHHPAPQSNCTQLAGDRLHHPGEGM